MPAPDRRHPSREDGKSATVRRLSPRPPDPEQPYFRRDSMYSRVWAERSVYIALPRMLLSQAAHPLVLSGVIGHSAWLGDQFAGRLLRTVKSFRTMAFAPRHESDRLIAVVNEMHDRVRGTLNVDDGGPRYPRGTEFWGLDPELLMWAMYAIFDSFELAYDTFVRRMTRSEKEEHWRDFRRVGRLFLLEDDEMPRTRTDVDEYGREMFATDRTVVTAVARRRGGEFIKTGHDVDEDNPGAKRGAPLVPWYGKPAWELVRSFTMTTLPERISVGYEFPQSAARAAFVRGAGTVTRGVAPAVPRVLRTWPEARGASGPWEDIAIKIRPNGSRLLVNAGPDAPAPSEPAADAAPAPAAAADGDAPGSPASSAATPS
jgi:uncharacterized protein (DUF2236 family)